MVTKPTSPVYVFDAYGTLFDVHAPAAKLAAEIGPEAARLSQIWRTKQLEYTWIRACAGRHASFRAMTEQGLDYAIASVGGVPAGVRAKLLANYDTLEAYPEVADVLTKLQARGARLAILSNGDPDMLAAAVTSSKLDGVFDAVISVADCGVFKPDRRVYALATDRFGVAPGEIEFQSSNRWDIAGGKAFGYRCTWINRLGLPDEYPDMAPDRVLSSLVALADL